MKTIDLAKLTKNELRNMLVNARNRARADVATDVLAEMHRRGFAERRDYDLLEWNQDRVKRAMQPFAEVSAAIPDNRRTAYTEAGGFKIGRAADHPEHMWIDTYTAIKTAKLNAVFVCYVRRPGDQPYFQLLRDGDVERRYATDEIDAALERWRAVAAEAVS